MKKRIAGLLMATVLVIEGVGNVSGMQMVDAAMIDETMVDETVQDASLSVENIEEVPEKEDLQEEEKEIVDEAVSVAEESGETAGEVLNGLEEDSEAVDIGVKEVLDTYYGAESVDEEAVEEFSETLEKDIEEDIVNYEEARAERDNEENLDFAAGEEIIIFDKDTPKEDIDTLATHLSDSYEILLDNDFELDTSLSERKQERLKALEDYKGDIVVKVNLDLDQTVAGAEAEFEEYDCVVGAEANVKYEENGLTSQLNDTYAGLQWYLDRCKF